MPETACVCTGCGASLGASPAVQRALAGSKGDPETPHLCWVCARLHNTTVREMVNIDNEVLRVMGRAA